MQLDERQLKYVYSVVAGHGVRDAAEQLGVDPSAVSRTIAGAERILGMTLFQRHGRSMEPTEAARMLHDYYRETLLQHADLQSKLDDLRGIRSGSIGLAVSEGFIEDLFDGPLDEFRQRYPAVRIELMHASVDEISRQVAESAVDLGVTYNAAPHEGVVVVASRPMPIDLIVPAGHPLAKLRRPVTIDELLSLPLALALVSSGYGLRRAVEVFEFTHRAHLKPVFTTNGLAALRGFVAHGHGATLLSHETMRREIEAGLVAALEIDDVVFRRAQAQLLARKGRRLSPASAEMVKLVATGLSMTLG
ncbi:LysR family transcriptional regulator [Devosia sp. ZB163]|uniref:LysR family transcriptional regulator n=1 Tax=Devosia sp. ZB163 TaxID=3025938 RepID=UPI00236098EC|nr:LysR family transcriptional regulator [Devosia sp. ZB163]MDC9822779.1 LysR family transcriptional regulator [Devosia sp. ZB163]